jgi:16S rRNA (cytosine967-C5)-methyltransferase
MNSAFAAGTGARFAAHCALTETLRRKRPLDLALDDAVSSQNLSARDSGFARAIANETVRRFGQLDALVRHFVPRAPPPHRAGPTLEILLAGACELLFLRVPPHAAVDGANRLAASDSKAVHFKPLINAALRRIAGEGSALIADQDTPRLNTPDWLWSRWCETYGEQTTRAIAGIHAAAAPLDIFVVRPDENQFADAATLPGEIVRLAHAGKIESLPGFDEGAFWVQDFAATLPVRLFGELRGKRVIDLCAAPGGKTAQLSASGARVTAVERDATRLARVARNLARLRLQAELVAADLRDYQPQVLADCVLLDVPCSATGTIRRHPELPWIKSAADVASCADAASDLLDAAAGMVTLGGQLVFAVCSLETEEGVEQIARFLERRTDFRRVPVSASELFGLAGCIDEAGDLRTLPCHLAAKGGMDGFYAARLVRL